MTIFVFMLILIGTIGVIASFFIAPDEPGEWRYKDDGCGHCDDEDE